MAQITKVQLSGLTCSACEKVISKKIKTIAGVQDVKVQAYNGSASIIASRSIGIDEVVQVLMGTHYKVINKL
jgi:copper chaperone CopZ